jgi:hypothetical protein
VVLNSTSCQSFTTGLVSEAGCCGYSEADGMIEDDEKRIARSNEDCIARLSYANVLRTLPVNQ